MYNMYSVVGGVYVLYHWFIEKSIYWDDFKLGKDDWELLQIGLVLLFLQVGRMRMEKKQTRVTQVEMDSRYVQTLHIWYMYKVHTWFSSFTAK